MHCCENSGSFLEKRVVLGVFVESIPSGDHWRCFCVSMAPYITIASLTHPALSRVRRVARRVLSSLTLCWCRDYVRGQLHSLASVCNMQNLLNWCPAAGVPVWKQTLTAVVVICPLRYAIAQDSQTLSDGI